LRRLQEGRCSSGETFSVRFSPCGVISNAHAMRTATGKPSNTKITTRRATPVGISKKGKIAIWISSQATTA
jgi:hypothetical protein